MQLPAFKMSDKNVEITFFPLQAVCYCFIIIISTWLLIHKRKPLHYVATHLVQYNNLQIKTDLKKNL